jgi:hypothetical protein
MKNVYNSNMKMGGQTGAGRTGRHGRWELGGKLRRAGSRARAVSLRERGRAAMGSKGAPGSREEMGRRVGQLWPGARP